MTQFLSLETVQPLLVGVNRNALCAGEKHWPINTQADTLHLMAKQFEKIGFILYINPQRTIYSQMHPIRSFYLERESLRHRLERLETAEIAALAKLEPGHLFNGLQLPFSLAYP